jgi:DNA-binding CsgD family transcriptional regulator
MGTVQELERLSGLIDFIYRGATEPTLWPEILARASDWLGSPKGLLFTPLHGPEQGGLYFQHGMPDFLLELYMTRFQALDLWTNEGVRRRVLTEGNVILGTDLVPTATLLQSPWYRDFLQLGDIQHLLTSLVFGQQPAGSAPAVADMPTACSFYRGHKDPDYTEGDRRKLALLLPHLSRALGVMTRLRLDDLRVAASLAALDRLPMAMLLLTSQADALFANRAATDLLASGDGLQLQRSPGSRGLGRLVARQPGIDRAIARALSSARGIDDVAHFSSVIKVPGQVPGRDWQLQLSRVSPGSAFDAGGQRPDAIAFLSAPHRPLDVAPAALCRCYGLTPAEARAAVAATAAGSLDEVARALSVGPNTVKTHLQRAYAKTGARSRAELVRLVWGVASAGSGGSGGSGG